MGREIRMVPPNWQHPTQHCHHCGLDGRRLCDEARRNGGMCYKPLNQGYAADAAEWKAEYAKWIAGEREPKDGTDFWDYYGMPPAREDYCPDWAEAEATHFQIYETVSEGTPVSPVFASRDELAQWLIDNGTSEAAARKFAQEGFCFSLMFDNGVIKEDYETVI